MAVKVPYGPTLSKPARCHPDQGHYSLGLCKDCWNKDWRRRNPDKVRATRSAAWKRWYKKTGRVSYTRMRLSAEAYTALLAEQCGLCAICRVQLVRPHIDHDHARQRVRGLLCRGCNLGLGHFKDNPVSLRQAAAYLEGL